MPEVAGAKREASNEERSGSAKKARGEGNLTLRFLLASQHAGGIIGKGGETIRRLRSEYSAQVYVPDNPGNERVMTIGGAERDNSIGVMKDCLPLMHEPPYPVGMRNGEDKNPDHFEINFLVHSSQVGGIIGSKGARVKQIREETNAGIKVYPDPLPGCTERVVAMRGTADQIVNVLEQVLDTMVEQPIKGDVILYDPSCSEESFDNGYGGGFNSSNYNEGGMGGGNFGGPQGGFGGGQNNFGQGGYGGNNNAGGGGNYGGGNYGGGAGGGGGNQGISGNASTQVTIPNDMAGAIIGQGGCRIKEIRQKCGAQIRFADPEPGKKDRLITISGSDEQIQYAQYLMQQCVLNTSNST